MIYIFEPKLRGPLLRSSVWHNKRHARLGMADIASPLTAYAGGVCWILSKVNHADLVAPLIKTIAPNAVIIFKQVSECIERDRSVHFLSSLSVP